MLILVCDIGGTSVKGGLVNQNGDLVQKAMVPCSPPVIDEQGWSEMDPEIWWQAFEQLCRILLEGVPRYGEIAAICLAGLTRTQVFVDHNGRVLRKAITWADSRADKQAAEIASKQADLGEKAETYGPINAFHTLARVMWIKDNQPELMKNLAFVLEPKDYINYRLTGEPAGDVISLSRLLTVSENKPADRLFESLDLDPIIFPPLLDPSDMLGQVQTGLSAPLGRLAEIPVYVGGMDAWAGALGCGAVGQTKAFNISGTSEVFSVTGSAFSKAPGLVSQPWGLGLYQTGGPSQSGADNLGWFAEAFHQNYRDETPQSLIKKLPGMVRQSEPILFFPYLQGERTPVWSLDARSAFIGVNRRHTQADFLWAIIEGVAYNNRHVLDIARENGWPAKEVRITGGASHSDLWCQIKADVLSLPVVKAAGEQSGLLGAAMIAMAGLNPEKTLVDLQEQLVRVDRVFQPRPERVEEYNRFYPIWLTAQKQILALTEKLTRKARQSL